MVSLRIHSTGDSAEPSRVRRSTSAAGNARIDAILRTNIQRYQNAPKYTLTVRIRQLEREWSIERLLETNASTLALAGVLLATRGHRRALLLSGTVLGFLLMHGVSGWCPPLPILRRAGVRTRAEIDLEKFALKYLRGDFEQLHVAAREGRLTTDLIVDVLNRTD